MGLGAWSPGRLALRSTLGRPGRRSPASLRPGRRSPASLPPARLVLPSALSRPPPERLVMSLAESAGPRWARERSYVRESNSVPVSSRDSVS